MLFKSRAWYLKGFCLIKQGIRLYKVSRIKNLTVTDETFAERDLRSPADSNTFDEPNNIAIKLRIEPEMSYRVFDDFHESMAEKQPDGSFIVTVVWPEDSWLYGFILSYGRYAEVIEPEHLRSIIKDEARKISDTYV